MKHNFSAGPSVIPGAVIDATTAALRNYEGTGLSVAEVSHRSSEWEKTMAETELLWRDLLSIPDGYRVLFLGGGASMQFVQIPYNFMEKKAAYWDTGVWAGKAIAEAKVFGEVEVVGSGKDCNYTKLYRDFDIPKDADYLHITTNNTIFGTEIREEINSPIPLIADMSSDILTRPIDISKYNVIYGGAQKNAGPAGVTFVIVREDSLGKVSRKIPAILKYSEVIKGGMMYNTPPVLPIFMMKESLKWLKNLGGIPAIQKINQAKSELLYGEIERNSMFKCVVPNKADRSLMNITFVFDEKYTHLEKDFLKFSGEREISGIGGHRLTGGFRASIYNAMPIESVNALANCMKEFENKYA